MEYLKPKQNATFHHKIKLKRFKNNEATNEIVAYIKKRHHKWILDDFIQVGQLERIYLKSLLVNVSWGLWKSFVTARPSPPRCCRKTDPQRALVLALEVRIL